VNRIDSNREPECTTVILRLYRVLLQHLRFVELGSSVCRWLQNIPDGPKNKSPDFQFCQILIEICC